MSMGLTGARVDACMHHPKGVLGPRNRPGSLRCLQLYLCAPGRGTMGPEQRTTSLVPHFSPILGFHGFCNHISRFDTLLFIF